MRASTIAYRAFQDLLGDRYGVRWIENYSLEDDPAQSFMLQMRALGLGPLYPDYNVLGPGEHPFPSKYATRFATMLIEPPVYLAAVLDDVLLRGGTLTIRSFSSPNEIAALGEATVFNCTGLGARDLFGDTALTPVKGQLSVLLPQPEVDYVTLGPDNLYMFPRPDGIVLGGTHQSGVWSLERRRGRAGANRRRSRSALRSDASGRRVLTPSASNPQPAPANPIARRCNLISKGMLRP